MKGPVQGIGHNSGRVDEPGKSWRTHSWARARKDLMPRLPIEVIRRRVARAQELGLPYKTYAGLRAASGDDLIGFMFSSNALDVMRRGQSVSAAKASKINGLVDTATIGLAHASVDPAQLTPPLDAAFNAPEPLAPWTHTRDALRAVFAQTKRPASRFVLVCDTALESEWASTARMAATLPAAHFFEAAP